MTFGKASAKYLGAVALGCIGSQSVAHAQGSPFTIRKPLDGSHVREKVKIEIPRASIGKGGFVAFYLDSKGSKGGQFMLGLAPSSSEDETGAPFTYVWDTKGTKISDGEHTIKAILYEPAGGSPVAMTEKATSEVHITVGNKILPGADVPTSVLIRYKYAEGEKLEYARSGKSVIVGHDSAMGGIRSDIDMMSARSKLLFSVEDVRYDSDAKATLALVRNKLTALSILNGSQEYTLQPTALSNSMYQELLPQGQVHYETGATTGLAEFMAQGLPVNNTLELPLMPTLRVSVGDTWTTPNQRLDIPGLPPILQPIVTLNNKFVDFEYEGGYPCIKIHQAFSGNLSNVLSQVTHDKFKALPFGGMLITSPTLTFDRDIYVAYTSGTLIRTARTLLIKGRTTSTIGVDPDSGPGSGGGGFGGGGGAMSPGSGGMRLPTTGGGGGGGAPMMPGSGGGGGMRPPGSGGGAPSSAGMRSPKSGGGAPASGGMRPQGGPMSPPGGGFGGAGGFSGGAEEVTHPISIRSTTDTDLLTQSGVGGTSHAAARPASIVIKKSGKTKKSR